MFDFARTSFDFFRPFFSLAARSSRLTATKHNSSTDPNPNPNPRPAMSLGSNPLTSSPHSDVLSAPVPDTPEGVRKLLEEIRGRGRSCVASGAWPWAEQLYAKGLELVEASGSGGVVARDLAVLYSNRSLAQHHLGRHAEARGSAASAVGADPAYLKGHWRLGQACAALGDWDAAVAAYGEAARVDSGQGAGMVLAITKEAQKCRERKEKERLLVLEGMVDGGTGGGGGGGGTEAVSEEELADMKRAREVSSDRPVPKPYEAPKPKLLSSSDGKGGDVVKEEGQAGDFTTSDHIKGYKIVNGKKTSFFHNEQSDEVRKLIGDIAPKRIGSDTADPSSPDAAAASGGNSAWNKAGTWEERDVTDWAAETLTASLLTATYEEAGTKARISRVTKMADLHDGGHASVAAVRGKKRYIYEFGYKLEWELDAGGNDEDDLRGTMTLPDIDGTVAEGDWHDLSDFTVEGGIPAARRAWVLKHLRDGGLRKAVEDQIDGWVVTLKATY